jgi:5-methylcytosine-specific restriction endonuclease McrA
MRNDILEKKEEILKMIKNNESKSFICRVLKCKFSTLESYLKKMNIVYSGNMGLKGKKISTKRKNTFEYIKNKYVGTSKLRKKLIEDGIKQNECEICGISDWLGNKITLELHHIDGNRFNNELNNLQILCPNCHSQTENHSGKANKKVKVKIKKQRPRKVERPDIDVLLKEIKEIGYSATGRKYGVSDNAIRKWIK